jgi:hypothetical protein
MDIKAKVHELGPIQNVTETFKKRDLILQYAENPSYPEYIKFEALQDKVSLFDGLRPGDEVEVFFNLRGRPWTDRNGKTSYFNTLVVWKMNKLGEDQQQSYVTPEYAPPADFTTAQDDDLPF